MRLPMRRSVLILVAVTVVAATAAAADAATRAIKVADNYYVRAGRAPILTVQRDDVIVWSFVGQRAHTVHSADKRMPFQSRPMTSGRFTRKMTEAGTFTIFCDIHGRDKMSMTLNVED
jgi:plastocyanin